MNVVVFDIRLNLRTNISKLILGNYFKKKGIFTFRFLHSFCYECACSLHNEKTYA